MFWARRAMGRHFLWRRVAVYVMLAAADMASKWIRTKECRVLTWRSWLLLLGFGLLAGWLFVAQIHGFLAVSRPVGGEVLVVEGWLPDYALESAWEHYQSGGYNQLLTTGIPLTKGSFLSEYENYANLAASTLRKLGREPTEVTAVPARRVLRNRTYESAVAVRDWLEQADIQIRKLDVVSLDTHARRTWYIYREVMPEGIEVGIIAAATQEYDPERWWNSSEGFKSVLDEILGCLQMRLYFAFTGRIHS